MMTKKEGKVLTRDDLARALLADIPTVGDAYDFVSCFFEAMSDQIASAGELKIHGFGRFHCIRKKSRIGRNPQTGEEVVISSRRVVSFVSSAKFKRFITENDERA